MKQTSLHPPKTILGTLYSHQHIYHATLYQLGYKQMVKRSPLTRSVGVQATINKVFPTSMTTIFKLSDAPFLYGCSNMNTNAKSRQIPNHGMPKYKTVTIKKDPIHQLQSGIEVTKNPFR